VLGGLDDSKILEEEAAKADVVVRKFSSGASYAMLTTSQTQPMHRITRGRPKPSPKVLHLATQKRSRDSGAVDEEVAERVEVDFGSIERVNHVYELQSASSLLCPRGGDVLYLG